MSMIEAIRRDAEAGTPGKWEVTEQIYRRTMTVESMGEHDIPCPGSGGSMSYTHDICTMGWSSGDHWSANANRIARVPDLERALLAADVLANAADSLLKYMRGIDDEDAATRLAISLYREATK